ncbi:MAG: anaerobic ribonucleoside-triphosphate reductase [Candidatus Nealsonbacteria bacterium]
MSRNKITKVRKRDKTIVEFDQNKISDAIFKALTATGQGDGKKSKRLSNKVVQILNRRFKGEELPHVEQIQDIIEEVLILEGLVDTAKAFILYREQRRRIRETMVVSEEAVERIDQYLGKLDWEVQENANMSFSLQGLNHYGVSYIIKRYWLNKIYPKEIREANESGDFHIHNLDTLGCYTFFGREVVIAKLNNQIKLVSFKDLYDELGQTEVLLNEKDEALAKYPENLYVLDKNGWTKVKRLVRKKKEREMLFIKSEQGRSIIVTDNHPFIIRRNGKETEIESKDVKEKEDFVFSAHIPSLVSKENLFSKRYLFLAEELLKNNYQKFFLEGFEWQDFLKNWRGSSKVEGTLSTSNSANSLDNKLELTEDLGYLVGIFITEGHYDAWRLVISNDDEEIIKRIRGICASLGVRSYMRENEERTKQIAISSSTLKLVFEKIFKIKALNRNKNLPLDVLNYNIDFIKGLIAGIIDGDGTVDPKDKSHASSQILIRVVSRTMLEQLAILLQFLGIIGRSGASTEDIGKKNIFKGKEIIQNYPLYRLSFSKKSGVDFPSFKYQKAKTAKKHWRAEKYDWNKVLNNKFTTIADDTIFDITTESSTFLANGLLVHNCMGWDLYDLLLRGFGGVSGKVESRPPKHLRPALGQAVNFLYTLQGEVAGAVAFSNFDTLLAPFIRYDNLNYKQVKQSLQEFLYNMAVPTRVGFQCPFSNITLDLKPSSAFAKQPVIIGGKPQKETYGEFEEEMRVFNKAFYEVMLEGDKSGRPFHFPIPTINITKDFPWDDPIFDSVFEASAKYGTNYFANYINSEMKPEDVRSMCLGANEEILIRNSKKIKRFSIKEIAENYKEGEFDRGGWAECKKEGNLEVLSLNPKNLKLEWSPVKRFLKIVDRNGVEIDTEDGKKSIFSSKHPIAVYTPEGIRMKFSRDIKKGDYLLTLKKANEKVLSKEYQKVGNFILKEDLAKILGYFVADGNYLFENRKGYTHYGEPRGLQFTFKTGDLENLNLIKSLIKKVFGLEGKEKQDPRYNTYYLYIYNTEISRKLYNAGFKKYGRLPQALFNSPPSVIKSFLDFHFKGDGYEKRKEIHINDLKLSRDLVLLYSLIGQPVTYKSKKRSQRIYLQHAKAKIKKGNGWTNNPIIAERIPGWMAVSTTKVPGLTKSRTVGFDTLEKYNAHTKESLKIKNSDIYLVRVKRVKIRKYKKLKEFYDIELKKNHLFVHSLGQISFNCCRLRLDLKELHNRGGGGLFGAGALTGSIGVVTINLSRIGYLSKTKREFFKRLGKLMDFAKESLEMKRKILENFIEKGLYPYSKYYLGSVKKMRDNYYGSHFSTIGLIGMNEALLNFIGENIASRRGKRFALEIMDFMRERLVKYQKETDNIYNLEQTPAESTAYRLALKDREKYPDIITAGTKKVPYYTNSSQLPVNYTTDAFEALKLQDEITCKYTGGSVLHLFLGERLSDIQTVKNLIKKVFEKFHLPYITLTPTFSICPVHGYLSGEHFECPKCTIKQPCEVYSRIVGYLRPVSQWNEGKAQEFKERKEFKIKELEPKIKTNNLKLKI